MAQVTPAADSRVREYETIYILRPDVPREGAERVSTRVQEAVAREGGKLTLVETWGRRALAYRVSKYRRGVYVYFKYVGQGGIVSEIERNLRMLDEVIKYQTVKLNDEVDVQALEVSPEDIEFEAVLPPDEDEVEESLARVLGLEESPRESASASEARGAHAPASETEDGEAADGSNGDEDAAPDSKDSKEDES